MAITEAAIDEAVAEKLRQSVRGQLLRPGDDDYDQARKLWNGMIDRRPAIILRASGVADVISGVRFAREHELLLAIKGGGHNVAGNALCDGGLVLDLSRMKGVRVDPAARTARAQAGCTWGDFDHETQAFGLATTGGVFSSTGIAGLTLGGGQGWLIRKFGLACDNVLSFDVVAPDGSGVKASAGENPDLYWGLRGGGGNFGVVTAFEYGLHPVGLLQGGMVAHPIARAREVLRFYRDWAADAPDELTTVAVLATLPDAGPLAVIMACYVGDLKAGEEIMRPIKEFGPPVLDHLGPIPYVAIQRMLDLAFPAGMLNYWKSSFMESLSDAAMDTIVDHFSRVPSPNSAAVLEQFGGVVKRTGPESTAFTHRAAEYNFLITSIWPNPADTERNVEWARDLWDAMQPHTSQGVYVNYLGQEGDERVRAAYGEAVYERLVALKNKWDPTNFFRVNQNIQPSG